MYPDPKMNISPKKRSGCGQRILVKLQEDAMKLSQGPQIRPITDSKVQFLESRHQCGACCHYLVNPNIGLGRHCFVSACNFNSVHVGYGRLLVGCIFNAEEVSHDWTSSRGSKSI